MIRLAPLALLASSCAPTRAPVAAAPPFSGTVALVRTATSTSAQIAFVGATLTPRACNGDVVDACCVSHVPAVALDDDATSPVPVDAGRIDIVRDTTTIASEFASALGYAPLSSTETPSFTWNPNDDLDVDVAGAQFPKFRAHVTAPPAIVGASLAIDEIVHTHGDVTLSWTPDAHVDPSSAVTATIDDVAGISIACTAHEEDSAIVVPKRAFADVSAQDTGTIAIARTASTLVTLDDATAIVSASSTIEEPVTFVP